MQGVNNKALKLYLIVAACEDMGIGVNGGLPWRLKKEMEYFKKMTTSTQNADKKNAVIMGRKTWESIPEKRKPLANRTNVVLSGNVRDFGENVLASGSLGEALNILNKGPYSEVVETVWIIGGHSLYKEAIESGVCDRIYLTEIKKKFECDTFMPPVPETYTLVTDERVPQGVQEEDGLEYEFKVYENSSQLAQH